MILEENKILKLSDKNEYLITHKIENDGINYYLLVDINDNSNVKFCYQDGNEVVEIEDYDKVVELLPLFAARAKETLPKEFLEQFGNQGA